MKPGVARWFVFKCLATSLLCLCVRMYVMAAGIDTPTICNRGKFVTGGKVFWGAFCIDIPIERNFFKKYLMADSLEYV